MTTLTFYMKSGNKIVIPFIKDYKMKTNGDQIIELTITKSWLALIFPTPKLIVSTISLSQIEAVTWK